jgi:hypothetical protein
MRLPDELEREFQTELKAFEEAKQMKFVTSIERMAEARGKGEAQQTIALNMLRDKLPAEQITRLTGLTLEEIQQLQAQMN